MRIAIPSERPGGIDGARSAHFGHCDLFTVVDIEEDQVTGVEILENAPHGSGGCLEPIEVLANAGVGAIVVAGVGARPMQALDQAGITVYYADTNRVPDVQTAVDKLCAKGLPRMQPAQACKGSGNCQH